MFKSKKNRVKSFVFICLAASLIAGVFAQINSSSGANLEFAQADDFPRGALVYAQVRDLPALFKLWDESKLKQDYLNSQNFAEFQNRHLALKLISRWQEFNEAFGFEVNAAKIAGTTDARAAVGVYDIGKIEFVFIAPLTDSKLAAALSFWNKSDFAENTLPDKTIYYSREVNADRGRQRQKIIFAVLKNRFVLATGEKLFFETIANLTDKTKKNRLSDEPDFSNLAAKTTAHLATVWVNQARLNEDWYFKHYWIMRNIAELKNIRAGIFDFETANGKFVERRAFLSNEQTSEANSNVSATEAEQLQATIPTDAAFFKIQSVANKPALAADLIVTTLLDKFSPRTQRKIVRRWNSDDSFNARDSSDYYNYSSLNSDFDENITEEKAADETVSAPNLTATKSLAELEQIINVANASAVATIAAPQVLENGLFAEFRRAAVFTLRTPTEFNQLEFEKCVLEIVQNRLGVAGANLNLTWETKSENGNAWRELELPALDWRFGYALRENELIIFNQTDLLKSMLTAKNANSNQSAAFDELTVIRLSRRQNAFDGVMKKLELKKTKTEDGANSQKTLENAEDDFFSGNIGSLLDTINDVDRIEIRKNSDGNYLSEEVSFVLK